MASEKVWIIYDSRAAGGDTDEAAIYETCESLEEARGSLNDWPDGVVYQYDIVNGEAINKQRVMLDQRSRR